MDLKPEMLADLNLASLQQRRAEAVEKHEEAVARVRLAEASHFMRYWLFGGAMALAAVGLGQKLPDYDYSPVSIFALSAFIILWLVLWIAAFFSAGAVRRLQDEAGAAAKQVSQIDLKIAFCNLVLDEANRARVRTYAQALVDRETR